ncbi:MAG: hypothetical protein GFH27_549285n284 [Chloroflexi bacterium AL-W]|nr:hypothetical protein [Chloroflexi bacterium AL-N1]NOK65796.1 hypothetical protein [Chloroflexi bacterium AL-N10]NOK74263.1 hypothetical protein [Chloroflexi bacterium AL-N5]NOK80829.1 hypothetical protein [Chloroflexi bacterium AL-W]NOK88521.1 hypothetical protein [Chloroflexi bacterium AL-N15]
MDATTLQPTVRVRWLFVWMACSAVVFIIISLLLPNILSDNIRLISFAALTNATALAWILWWCRRTGITLRQIIGGPPQKRKHWELTGLFIRLIWLDLSILLLLYTLAVFLFPTSITAIDNLPSTGQTEQNIYVIIFNNFILSAFIGPIVEECVFRGILLRRWTYRWNIYVGILLSSIIFGLFHLNVLGSFIFGVVLCLVYIQTQTLWIPIAIHILNNLSLSVMSILPSSSHSADNPLPFTNLWEGLFISLIVVSPFADYSWIYVLDACETSQVETTTIDHAPDQLQSLSRKLRGF